MRKSNGAVSLVLIGSMAVFFGFKSCMESREYSYSSTQPSSGSGGHYFWSRGSSGSGSSSGHSFGTSRGGFGSSGHSVGA